jgi:hypothetical protein
LKRYASSDHLGFLLTPRAANSVATIKELDLPWAADNSAYSGFSEVRFARMLDRIEAAPGLLWVAVPDVVEDMEATLRLFGAWQPRLAARGLPVALVAQDGLEDGDVPWDRLDALFIGGSTGWKLSDQASRLCRQAKDRGLLTHVGRVNSKRRLFHLARWGCVDSVDGSGFSRWPDTKIPRGLRWIAEALGHADTGDARRAICSLEGPAWKI